MTCDHKLSQVYSSGELKPVRGDVELDRVLPNHNIQIKVTVKYSLSPQNQDGWNLLEPDETILKGCLTVRQREEKNALVLFHTGHNQLLGLYAKRNRAGRSLFNWLLTAGA